jgi:hypothetical protein
MRIRRQLKSRFDKNALFFPLFREILTVSAIVWWRGRTLPFNTQSGVPNPSLLSVSLLPD